MPHPNLVLLLTIVAHRTGQSPDLGQSLQHLLGQHCHLKPCLPQLAPAMCEVVVVLLSHLQCRLPCISKQYWVSGKSGVGFLAGDWDGEHDGALPNSSKSSGPFWPLGGVRVWPSGWILIPGFWSSRLLDLVATDMKTVAMNWNSGYVHSVWVQRPMQENKETTGLVVTTLNSWWMVGPFICHQWALSHTQRMLPIWGKVSDCLINDQISNLRDSHDLPRLMAAKPDLLRLLALSPPRDATNVMCCRLHSAGLPQFHAYPIALFCLECWWSLPLQYKANDVGKQNIQLLHKQLTVTNWRHSG